MAFRTFHSCVSGLALLVFAGCGGNGGSNSQPPPPPLTTPTLGALTVPAKVYGDAPFALSPPSSDSTGPFTYASANPAVATIAGGTVSITGVGSTTITVTQAAEGNFAAANRSASLVVAKLAPTLNWPGLTRNHDDPPFALTPPASNSLGAFSYFARSGAVSVVGNIVTIFAGPVASSGLVLATQAETGNHLAAEVVLQMTIVTPFPAGYVAQPALLWAPQDGTLFIWAAADTHCAGAAFLGLTGWRLAVSAEMNAMLGKAFWFGLYGRGYDEANVWSAASRSPGTHDVGWENPTGNAFIAALPDDSPAQAGCVRTLP